ncbi:hypothetical protein [Citrobacter sp. FDAARGOS_156]|uniref:hypothetical protein n=1 Tax=Citrobacter sp. FDAARGOS_156 TaxID=1702170 RepID=UPI000A88CF29|nr:hypothetical protein [Citrobacter sp. FDAARGOS_156]
MELNQVNIGNNADFRLAGQRGFQLLNTVNRHNDGLPCQEHAKILSLLTCLMKEDRRLTPVKTDQRFSPESDSPKEANAGDQHHDGG